MSFAMRLVGLVNRHQMEDTARPVGGKAPLACTSNSPNENGPVGSSGMSQKEPSSIELG